MKTTLEIPDDIFGEAKATASSQGRPLKELVVEALREKLSHAGSALEPPWRRAHGTLRHLRVESRRVRKRIEAEFEGVDQS